MIPKLSFPVEKLRMVPLFQDSLQLEDFKTRSATKNGLSKVAAAYHDLYFPTPSRDRPYTFASMVLSLDGKMAFPDNPQGPVVASANAINREGGLADFWVLNVLRAYADGIILGAKTLSAEPDAVFTCLDPDLVAERGSILGKKDDCPLTIVVSLDGTDVPLEHALFASREIPSLIATSSQGGEYLRNAHPLEVLLVGPFLSRQDVDEMLSHSQLAAALQTGKKVILMTGKNAPDAALLLYALRKVGIEYLLIESPTYLWHLMSQQLLDEFFVNYSSLFIGGSLTPGSASPFSSLAHPHIQFLFIGLHQNSFLFTRQKLIYNPAPNA